MEAVRQQDIIADPSWQMIILGHRSINQSITCVMGEVSKGSRATTVLRRLRTTERNLRSSTLCGLQSASETRAASGDIVEPCRA